MKNFLAYTLRRLGTDYVDIYRPARVDPTVPIEDTIGAIADMVRAGYPGRAVTVETFYLAARERIPVPAKNDDKAIDRYSDAIAVIEAGDFHAAPDQRRCPSCQCYFMCGA